MSSVKVSSGAPVGASTSMMKSVSARMTSSSSSPVSATSESAGVGTSADQYLQNGQDGYAEIFSRLHEEEDKPVSGYEIPEVVFTYDAPETIGDELFSPQDAARQIGSYETAQEAADSPSPKKSTKAFG